MEYFTQKTDFFKGHDPHELIKEFGSPLYVYNEDILRSRCIDMRELVGYDKFRADYSIKANSNLHLLKIVHEEGLEADAMSPGEIAVLLAAGFKPEEIFFVCNNISAQEMAVAVEHGIVISIDSLSQLETYGQNFPGTSVAVRFNTGHGAGHHEKVITAGKLTKFGINYDDCDRVVEIAEQYDLRICGLNHHIGSLFMEESAYIAGAEMLLALAKRFPELDFVDLGGGFGVPYNKQAGQQSLDLAPITQRLTALVERFSSEYGREIKIKIEPGRYIVAECGVLLGQITSVKENSGTTFVGCDIGFNVLQRPVMYDSHHDIEVYPADGKLKAPQTVTVVGNICESGDKLAVNRLLPQMVPGDVIGVMDAGAYGYSMASNYNHRLRPAEVLITSGGEVRLIRRRDSIEDLLRAF